MDVKSGRVQTKWLDIEYLEVAHSGKGIRYAASGASSVKRVRSLFEKEPITIAWIDNFAEGATLFDVGANVGTYTIYAAVTRQARVFSFEPEALNYAEVNKNIFLNNLHGQVLAYCVALSDEDKTDRLLLSDFGLGISYHDFEENTWTEDKQFAADWICKKDERRPQGCFGRRLDSFIADGLPVPDHIKIDVDGLEYKVFNGMRELLANPGVQTVLIEINFDQQTNIDIIDKMASLGWRFSWNQLRAHRKLRFSLEQVKAALQSGKGGFNYIFYKDEKYDRFFDHYFETYKPST